MKVKLGSQNSIRLQAALHTAIMAELMPFGVIDRKQKIKNLHMVRESKMPALLTENLFIDVKTFKASRAHSGYHRRSC